MMIQSTSKQRCHSCDADFKFPDTHDTVEKESQARPYGYCKHISEGDINLLVSPNTSSSSHCRQDRSKSVLESLLQ